MSEQTKEIELLPCPFCGGKADFKTVDGYTYPDCKKQCIWFLGGMYGGKDAVKNAARLWNQRQPPVENAEFANLQQEFVAEKMRHTETNRKHLQRFDGLRLAAEKVLHLIRCHMVYEKDGETILKHALESARGGE